MYSVPTKIPALSGEMPSLSAFKPRDCADVETLLRTAAVVVDDFDLGPGVGLLVGLEYHPPYYGSISYLTGIYRHPLSERVVRYGILSGSNAPCFIENLRSGWRP